MSAADPTLLSALAFNADGLVSVTVQDVDSRAVLMVAWMNAEALQQTLASGDVVFWSRSRQALWRKGESSGMGLKWRDIFLDCDGDALLIVAQAIGPACHTGRASCFYRRYQPQLHNWQDSAPVLIDPQTLYGKSA